MSYHRVVRFEPGREIMSSETLWETMLVAVTHPFISEVR